jgi:hypothetical protein
VWYSTLNAESEGRLTDSFTTAVGGAASVQSGSRMRDGSEDETHVAKHHTGADVMHQTYTLGTNVQIYYYSNKTTLKKIKNEKNRKQLASFDHYTTIYKL